MTNKEGDTTYNPITTEDAAKTMTPLFAQATENLADLIRKNLEKTYEEEFAPLASETASFPQRSLSLNRFLNPN